MSSPLDALKQLRARADALLANRPFKAGQEEIWLKQCEKVVRAVFGEDSGHIEMLTPRIRVITNGFYSDSSTAARVQRTSEIIDSFIEALESDTIHVTGASEAESDGAFWDDVHPAILGVAKTRYDAAHYADAAEASFKEIETMVKALHKAAGKQEAIGANLMRAAFSPDTGSILLENLSTQDGMNIQRGYMDIAAGAMTGIRNPKAHGNVHIDAQRARHFIYLASLLAYVISERKINSPSTRLSTGDV